MPTILGNFNNYKGVWDAETAYANGDIVRPTNEDNTFTGFFIYHGTRGNSTERPDHSSSGTKWTRVDNALVDTTIWQGTWTAVDPYDQGSLVLYENRIYVKVANNQLVDPPTTAGSGWHLLALQTAPEIKTLYESNPNTNALTNDLETEIAVNTAARHNHANKADLDQLTIVNGELNVNGNPITANGNPLVSVSRTNNIITFTAQDGTTTDITIPTSGSSGGGGGGGGTITPQTATQIRDLLNGLTAANRLSVNALKDVPTWLTGTTLIPDSKIPGSIARDSEVNSLILVETNRATTAETALGTRIDDIPAGARGEQGIPGVAGAAGATGAAGIRGEQGIRGNPGILPIPYTTTDHYLHLGNHNLRNLRGLVSGATTVNLDNTPFNLRFDTNGNIPTGGSNNEANGEIILPAGYWTVFATVNATTDNIITDPAASGARGAERVQATLSIYYGANERHAQSVYLRNNNFDTPTYQNLMGKVTTAGAVISDGITPVTIKFEKDSQSTNTIELEGAHIHCFEQIEGNNFATALQGDAGAAGARGSQGRQGIQGQQGIRGSQGLRGAAGNDGATGATGTSTPHIKETITLNNQVLLQRSGGSLLVGANLTHTGTNYGYAQVGSAQSNDNERAGGTLENAPDSSLAAIFYNSMQRRWNIRVNAPTALLQTIEIDGRELQLTRSSDDSPVGTGSWGNFFNNDIYSSVITGALPTNKTVRIKVKYADGTYYIGADDVNIKNTVNNVLALKDADITTEAERVSAAGDLIVNQSVTGVAQTVTDEVTRAETAETALGVRINNIPTLGSAVIGTSTASPTSGHDSGIDIPVGTTTGHIFFVFSSGNHSFYIDYANLQAYTGGTSGYANVSNYQELYEFNDSALDSHKIFGARQGTRLFIIFQRQSSLQVQPFSGHLVAYSDTTRPAANAAPYVRRKSWFSQVGMVDPTRFYGISGTGLSGYLGSTTFSQGHLIQLHSLQFQGSQIVPTLTQGATNSDADNFANTDNLPLASYPNNGDGRYFSLDGTFTIEAYLDLEGSIPNTGIEIRLKKVLSGTDDAIITRQRGGLYSSNQGTGETTGTDFNMGVSLKSHIPIVFIPADKYYIEWKGSNITTNVIGMSFSMSIYEE